MRLQFKYLCKYKATLRYYIEGRPELLASRKSPDELGDLIDEIGLNSF